MIKSLNEFIVNNKLKFFFKKRFTNKKKNKSNKVLLEFNAFHSYHIPVSYFSNYLSKKYNDSNLVGFFNYKILSSPLKENMLNKIKWYIGNNLNLKYFSIYKSFGVNEIFKPIISDKISNTAKKEFFILKNQIKTKKDILDIKIKNVEIGDLIYDTFIKSKKKPTILIDDNFFDFLGDFLKLYFFWDNYFENNNVKAIIGVHSVYSYAIPLRIAMNKNIPTYCVTFRKISKINNNMKYFGGEFVEFKNKFKKIENNLKQEGIKLAKKKIEYRFSGVPGIKSDLITSEISSFGNKFLPSLIKNNSKKKIIIFPHDFFDAVHAHGRILFEDFYEWLEYLGKISKKTNYEWYIKNRPNFSGKFKIYQPQTENVINEFIKKYPHITKLPNDYSHNQIIKEGIDCALTVYGSVGFEYALFNIPVINASTRNTHSNYDFNFHPKNLNEYEYLIFNFDNKKLEIKKSEIYEYYFMKHIYNTKNWLIDDLEHFMKFVGDYSHINSFKFYEYWMKNVTLEKEQKINQIIKNFLESNDYTINMDHLN